MNKKVSGVLENLFVVFLAFYPLRHVNWGLDLWDTGYNYANYQFMGTEHMDPMWLFSTYLTNVVGHFLTGLPNGGSLLGMNVYTGLFVSLLAVAGYFFWVRVMKIRPWMAFLGEFLAMSLCWCPTAKLYDYLTYVFMFFGILLLYRGLLKEKRWSLFGAGVCLGANVFVRFSNLPEAAFILAVWGYDVLLERDIRLSGMEKPPEKFWARTARHTAWCLAGYAAAAAVLLIDIHMRYGLGNYVEGIRQLFAMTDNAGDYRPKAMIMSLVGHYVQNMYWVIRLGVIAAGGTALFAAAGFLKDRVRCGKKIMVCVKAFWILVCAGMLLWLYMRGVFSFLYYSYDSIWYPGVLFLMLTMFLALICIFTPSRGRDEKLLGMIVLLIVLLTSVGSNNGFFPSLNNLFLAAPYTVWQSFGFIKTARERYVGKVFLSAFPAKGVLTAFLALCVFQFGMFGAVFVFAEATGVRGADSYVENNEILKGIRMPADKAQMMTQLSEYADEKGLWGQEVILYGNIPAISYYLQMPSAFNPWCSLDSYSLEKMELALKETAERMAEEPEYSPVIFVESDYITYQAGEENALEELGFGEYSIRKIAEDLKWERLVDFMEEQGYVPDYSDEKFTVFLKERTGSL